MDEKAILQKMILDSLGELYTRDHYLIWNRNGSQENHVSERGLVFRFGIYFDALAQIHFPTYHVDSEYNRNIDYPKLLPSWTRGSYPDLIVHKRGKNSGNLLIIEVKTWWYPEESIDKLKIEQYCDPHGEYHYSYGALIIIGKTRKCAKIKFYIADTEEWLCLDTPNLTTNPLSSSSSRSN